MSIHEIKKEIESVKKALRRQRERGDDVGVYLCRREIAKLSDMLLGGDI